MTEIEEFLANDSLRPLRLECLDAVTATGRPLRASLPQALELICWLVRHHQGPGEAARLAVEMLTR
jgi:hypothetical protein